MNPLTRLVANAMPGKKRFVLLAGAGISKDAGIPTAWDLILKTAKYFYADDHERGDPPVDLNEWFINSKYAQLSYSELIGKLFPHSSEQREFLMNFLGGKEIGESHRGIADLAKRGIIRTIITTNFDDLIESALKDVGMSPQVISSVEDLKSSEPLIQCERIRIYKPHGDLNKGFLRNTPKDVERLDPEMENELITVFSDHGVLVLGYSGQDEGIREVFRRRRFNNYSAFWADPVRPDGEMKTIMDSQDILYLQIDKASSFLARFREKQEQIIALDLKDENVPLEKLRGISPVVPKPVYEKPIETSEEKTGVSDIQENIPSIHTYPALKGLADFTREDWLLGPHPSFIHSKQGAISVWVEIKENLSPVKRDYLYLWGTSKPTDHVNWANLFALRYVASSKSWQFVVHGNDEFLDKSRGVWRVHTGDSVNIDQSRIGYGWRFFVVKWNIEESPLVKFSIYDDNQKILSTVVKRLKMWPSDVGDNFIVGNWYQYAPTKANTRLFQLLIYEEWPSNVFIGEVIQSQLKELNEFVR